MSTLKTAGDSSIFHAGGCHLVFRCLTRIGKRSSRYNGQGGGTFDIKEGILSYCGGIMMEFWVRCHSDISAIFIH